MRIVLASGSPRRKELLEMLGVKNMLVIPAVGEEAVMPGSAPQDTVMALALAKASEVAAQRDAQDVVIAADTIVWLDGELLGKPKTRERAAQMLRALSGREHEVYSGVTVMRGSEIRTAYERTRVRFRQLTDREIDAYIATGEPMDKAGAYGAQGLGSLFVEGITGDFFNVMGLPLCTLGRMLEKMGVELL